MQSVAQTEPFYLFQKLKKDLTDSPIFDILQFLTVLDSPINDGPWHDMHDHFPLNLNS